jgi:hypothetical protein
MIITMTAIREIQTGELVTSADVAPYRQKLAEYLARRERALDWLAALSRDNDLVAIHAGAIESRGGRVRWAWWVTDTGHMKRPPPRDKRPLPLP